MRRRFRANNDTPQAADLVANDDSLFIEIHQFVNQTEEVNPIKGVSQIDSLWVCGELYVRCLLFQTLTLLVVSECTVGENRIVTLNSNESVGFKLTSYGGKQQRQLCFEFESKN